MRWQRYKSLVVYITLLFVVVVVFTPLISRLSTIGFDYITHLRWASEMESQGKLILPHPLYHVLVIAAKNLFTINYIESSTVVILCAIFLLAVLNYRILVEFASTKSAVLLSLCLLVVTPIQLLYFVDQHLYFGYIGVTIYHSPTMLLLKPLSLIAFCYVLKAESSTSENTLRSGSLLALFLVLSGISKPNFLMIILPAFVVFLFVIGRLRPMLKQRYIHLAFFLPVISVLAVQFIQTYLEQKLAKSTGGVESNIAFMPFVTMSYYSKFLFYKFFLSVAFPLTVLLCYARLVIKDKPLVLAFICLGMGASLSYLFAENGHRLYDGNFWWSGQIGLYLAFLFSLVFLLRNRHVLTSSGFGRIKYAICFALFFAHTAFGIFYYRQELLAPYAKFW